MRKNIFCVVELIIGVLMIALGVYTFVNPSGVMDGFARAYAVLAIISGIRDIVFYCKAGRYTGFRSILSVITSIIGIMSGVALFVYPGAGAIIISLIIPMWFISHSVFQLANLDIIKEFMTKGHYLVSLIGGIIGLILGIVAIFYPIISVTVAAVAIALYLIATGVMSIIIGISQLELKA